MRNLKILAAWLAANAGVEVETYNGRTACISVGQNGKKVIKLPANWVLSSDPESEALIQGVIDHEALGHGRYTDFDAKEKSGNLVKWNNFTSGLLNILEDVYIENRAINTYPGVKSNLVKTVEVLVQRDFFGNPEAHSQAEGSALILSGLLNCLRAKHVPGQDKPLANNAEFLHKLLDQKLGGLWQEIFAIAGKCVESKSTMDNIVLTAEIVALLESTSQEEQEQQEQQQQQKGESSDDGEADEADESDGGDQGESQDQNQDAGESGDGEAESEGESGEGEEGQSSDQNSEGEGDAEGDGESQSQPGEKSGTSITAGDILKSMDGEMPETELTEGISEEVSKSSKETEEIKAYDIKRNVEAISLKIASQFKAASDELVDALTTQTQCRKSNAYTGKRLNSRILARTRLGDGRVFSKKTTAEGVSTAVYCLLDFSGSMLNQLQDGPTRRDAASGLAYGLADVLDEYNVPFAISAYSQSFGELKTFDQDWSAVRKKQEEPGFSGSTLTGQALEIAIPALLQRDEERKLIILVTDGEPECVESVEACYAEAKRYGVEIATVFLGNNVGSIQKLAQKVGFKVMTTNSSKGLATFAIQRILESI